MGRILLLHEDFGHDETIRDYLKIGGYTVLEEELERAREHSVLYQDVDIIVVECDEPAMCVAGCETIRTLTDKPMVIFSTRDTEWQKVKLLQSGADDYIVLPCSQIEIIARLNAHIDFYERLTKTLGRIEVKGLTIDACTRTVTVYGKPVELRMKEFDILLYLAQHKNQVVTREELYKMIWGANEPGPTYNNTVAVHIKRIRKKIEQDVDNPQFVETIWGVGYRFSSVERRDRIDTEPDSY